MAQNIFSHGANNFYIPNDENKDKINPYRKKDSYPYNFGKPKKRLSLTDHLSNMNIGQDDTTDNFDYRNSLRGMKNTLRRNHEDGYDPMEGPGTPGERRVPNQLPPPTASAPLPRQADNGGQIIQNVASVAAALNNKPAITEHMPGQTPGQAPGTINMAAVNAPEAGRIGPKPKFDADKFARIAGAMGAAIGGPNTWQGRLGMVASKLAGENIAERKGAPDVAQARRLRAAQIKKAETPEDNRTLRQKEVEYYSSLKTPEQKASYDKLYGKDDDDNIKEQKKLEYYQSLDADGQKTYDKIFGKQGSYYRVTDDKGNVSVYQGDKLLSGSGKGKSKSKAKEKLYKTERGYLTAGEAKGLKPWEKDGSEKNITPAQQLQRDKAVLKVEEDISEGEATMGDIGFFNKYHKGPYIYAMKKGEKKYGMFGWDFMASDTPDSLERIDFKNPEDVKKAYADKTISRDKASQLLLDNFEGFEK